jgi:hypothetical protein
MCSGGVEVTDGDHAAVCCDLQGMQSVVEDEEIRMSQGSELSSPVWLLMGATGSVGGSLRLTHHNVSFTVIGRGALTLNQSAKLDSYVDGSGLNGRWNPDGSAVVFDVPRSTIDGVRFPWYEFGGGMRMQIGGERFRFSFLTPANIEAGTEVIGISQGRATGRRWREALRA